MHYALQKHVGKDALQRGSKVSDDELRFDFGHPTQVPKEKLVEIENEVNAKIAEAAPINWKNLPIAEARSRRDDALRREVSRRRPHGLAWATSARNSAAARTSTTRAKSACSRSSAKRTSPPARAASRPSPAGRRSIARASTKHCCTKRPPRSRSPIDDLPTRVAAMAKEVKELKKQLATGVRAGGPTVDQMLADAATVGATKVVAAEIPGGTADTLRAIIDQLRQKSPSVAALLGARDDEGKVMLVGRHHERPASQEGCTRATG